MTMEKIALSDARSLLKTAAATIRSQKQENVELQEKLASYERQERVTKIARDMEEKGLNGDLTFEEKVASLRTAPDLDVTEAAVKMAAPQGRLIGSPSDQPGGGSSLDAFTTFINTGEFDSD